jgi:hypothetical protein
MYCYGLRQVCLDSPDRDGDGILDAEELNPINVNVNAMKGYYCPGEYDGKVGYRYHSLGPQKLKNYDFFWEETYHDIDMHIDDGMSENEKTDVNNFNIEMYQLGTEVDGTYWASLDPTNPDTDGDGVPDGVEITDSRYIPGRTDRFGNPLGRWPNEDDFNELESTNPLDPTDY